MIVLSVAVVVLFVANVAMFCMLMIVASVVRELHPFVDRHRKLEERVEDLLERWNDHEDRITQIGGDCEDHDNTIRRLRWFAANLSVSEAKKDSEVPSCVM